MNKEYRTNFEFEEDEKPKIIVRVRNLLGKEQKFRIMPNEKVERLNALVHKTFEISPRLQCLVYEGVILEVGKKVSDYQIKNNSLIKLIIN